MKFSKQKEKQQMVKTQLDFSENYAVSHQNEIQSAQWNQKQLTLFTTCSWILYDIVESMSLFLIT